MLQYCEGHQQKVNTNRWAITHPAALQVTDPKLIKFLASEKRNKKKAT